jgi:hypothetical protein
MTEVVLFIVALVILLQGLRRGTKKERLEKQIKRMKAHIVDLEVPADGKNMVYCYFVANLTRREIEKLERELEE